GLFSGEPPGLLKRGKASACDRSRARARPATRRASLIHNRSGPRNRSDLDRRGLIDLVDGISQLLVELGVGHRTLEALGKRAREACDHAVIFGETLAGVV